ncbi:MAG: hypothetical protein AAF646_10860 [Pseudomonadota bacterium]
MTDPKKPEDEAPEDEATAKTDGGPEAEETETAGSKTDTGDDTSSEEAPVDGEPAAEKASAARAEDAAETASEDGETAKADGTGPSTEEGALSEDEQREIAEDALRDAETSYVAPDSESKASDDTPSDAAGLATAAAGAAAATQATGGTAAPPAPPKEVVVEKRGGILSGVVGGVIAVAAAVIALPYVLPEDMRPVMSLAPVEDEIAAQSAELAEVAGAIEGMNGQLESTATALDALGGRIGATESALSDAVGAAEITALEDRLDTIQADMSAQNAALSTRIEEVADLLSQFERNPIESATDPAIVSALANYAREVEALRDEVAATAAANAAVIEEAAAATAEARALAEAEQEAAAARAADAARQQALVDIKAALDAGAPFGEALDALGADVPAALSDVASGGVPTLAALQASFSEPARDALDAARRASVGEAPAERGLSFLQTQLGMRSLTPREGDSADAVLSRAEAAARDGDLATALSELGALPEPAAAAMADWAARAAARAKAVAAADALARSMATN